MDSKPTISRLLSDGYGCKRLAAEFPVRATQDIVQTVPRELWPYELSLQWSYMEERGEIVMSPPREAIEIRREIRSKRIRLRGKRKRHGLGLDV